MLARGLHKQQVLLGEREDGDAGQIDLLPARELQQKIEGALEPVEIDRERELVTRLLKSKSLRNGASPGTKTSKCRNPVWRSLRDSKSGLGGVNRRHAERNPYPPNGAFIGRTLPGREAGFRRASRSLRRARRRPALRPVSNAGTGSPSCPGRGPGPVQISLFHKPGSPLRARSRRRASEAASGSLLRHR